MSNWKNPIINEFARFMGADPVSAIRDECKYLLRSAGITLNTNKAIDIDKIAKHLGLKDDKYMYTETGPPAYLDTSDDGSIKIHLTKDYTEIRNLYQYRFIIAHEIGHILIRNKIKKKFSETEEREIELYHKEEEDLCQYAASELLLPDEVFLPQITKINHEQINYLSKKFQVSISAIINRIAYLLPNYIAVYWKYRESPTSSEKVLRVTWLFPPSYLKRNPYIPIHASAKNDRFSPNIVQKAYDKNISITNIIEVKDFGSLNGKYKVFVYNPKHQNTLFDLPTEIDSKIEFDLYSLFDFGN